MMHLDSSSLITEMNMIGTFNYLITWLSRRRILRNKFSKLRRIIKRIIQDICMLNSANNKLYKVSKQELK
jgi:hypothetical protein